jgi:hypothetical protein
MLSSTGLDEDSNDDYAKFVTTFLVPLSTAGVTTLTLDNTGHEEKTRARGASAKADLNEVVYVIKTGKKFDRELQGHVRLDRTRSRFSDLPEHLYVPLGGGSYGPVTTEVPEKTMPTDLMEHISLLLEKESPLSQRKLLDLTRARDKTVKWAIECLDEIGCIEIEPGKPGQPILHRLVKKYRAPESAGE